MHKLGIQPTACASTLLTRVSCAPGYNTVIAKLLINNYTYLGSSAVVDVMIKKLPKCSASVVVVVFSGPLEAKPHCITTCPITTLPSSAHAKKIKMKTNRGGNRLRVCTPGKPQKSQVPRCEPSLVQQKEKKVYYTWVAQMVRRLSGPAPRDFLGPWLVGGGTAQRRDASTACAVYTTVLPCGCYDQYTCNERGNNPKPHAQLLAGACWVFATACRGGYGVDQASYDGMEL